MEKWKAVRGYKGLYEVSNRGRVRSLPRVIVRSNGKEQSIAGRMLKCKPFGKQGYVQVNLSDRSNGKGGPKFVHKLVVEAFVGKCPEGCDRICHKDDIGSNNWVKNLYWGTASSNGTDAWKNGKHKNTVRLNGTDVYNSVQDKKVLRVLRLRSKKLYLKDIAEKVGLNVCTVHQICNFRGRFKEFEQWNS